MVLVPPIYIYIHVYICIIHLYIYICIYMCVCVSERVCTVVGKDGLADEVKDR